MALPTLATADCSVLVCFAAPVEIAESAQAVAALLRMLDDEERARYARFLFDEDRLTYLAAHALTRGLLAAQLGVGVEQLVFQPGEHGRPELAAPLGARGLRFNLSHTRGLVACALTQAADIGVDVEHVDRRVELAGVARHVFSDQELSGLWELSEDQQRSRFFELWTLKEAYIKAIGKGLSAPLRSITFHPESKDPVRLSFGPEVADDASSWCMRRFVPSERHRIALAFRGRSSAAVRCIEVALLELVTP